MNILLPHYAGRFYLRPALPRDVPEMDAAAFEVGLSGTVPLPGGTRPPAVSARAMLEPPFEIQVARWAAGHELLGVVALHDAVRSAGQVWLSVFSGTIPGARPATTLAAMVMVDRALRHHGFRRLLVEFDERTTPSFASAIDLAFEPAAVLSEYRRVGDHAGTRHVHVLRADRWMELRAAHDGLCRVLEPVSKPVLIAPAA